MPIKNIYSNGLATSLNLPNKSFDLDLQRLLTHQQTNYVKENKEIYTSRPPKEVV